MTKKFQQRELMCEWCDERPATRMYRKKVGREDRPILWPLAVCAECHAKETAREGT